MRLLPSDPDVQTIVARIRNNDINLQPDFQRGEVWSEAKKRRLIDSILRDWHVPPIHVVEVRETSRQEVLDGQQRLVAIRDFSDGHLTVDGHIEPRDAMIEQLHGLKYAELPPAMRRRFDQFTIRVFRIIDYRPGEPGELFFRLNQPTNLTPAEQRNAFFGPAREQVKELVNLIKDMGLTEESLGFSNTRIAYDDVVARFCLTLDKGNLREQVTAANVTDRYRSSIGFSKLVFDRAASAIELLAGALKEVSEAVRFNKTTLYSWLCFLAETLHPVPLLVPSSELGRFIVEFEKQRAELKAASVEAGANRSIASLLVVFNDRASSRVADVTSVLSRDIIIWLAFTFAFPHVLQSDHPRIDHLKLLHSARHAREIPIEAYPPTTIEFLINRGWGTVV